MDKLKTKPDQIKKKREAWKSPAVTKDETSGILRKFITEIENLKDLKVKIIRVLVNKAHNKTPYELFNGRTPAIGFLKPFRCYVMILNTLDNLDKFEAKRDEGYFLGYSMSSKAFRIFNKRTKRVEENVHIEFLENKAIEKGSGPNCGNSNPTATSTNPPDDQLETLTVETPIPTASLPVLTVSFTDSQEPLSETRLISKRVTNQAETSSLDNIITLTNQFEDILRDTSNSKESNGVEADVSNMEITITASPTPTLRIHRDHPKRVRPIGIKWVLKNKKDERGIVIRNKTRLVAQGHTQEEGIDYDELFAPIARIKAIRLFLAYASFMGFTVYQMDVKSAFLYGFIDEELCREFKALMHEKFQMSAMGELNFFIGLQVLQKEDGIFLSQDKYVGDILKKFRYSDVKSSNTPMDKENPWGKDVKRIFQYLKGHPKLGLWYPKDSPFDLVAYSDSDYGGATQDRKSTSGGCQFLGRRLISWQCKKQTIVATSTTEAEYVTAA
nr:copia protein [Tanacetum cinerariifolium]